MAHRRTIIQFNICFFSRATERTFWIQKKANEIFSRAARINCWSWIIFHSTNANCQSCCPETLECHKSDDCNLICLLTVWTFLTHLTRARNILFGNLRSLLRLAGYWLCCVGTKWSRWLGTSSRGCRRSACTVHLHTSSLFCNVAWVTLDSSTSPCFRYTFLLL